MATATNKFNGSEDIYGKEIKSLQNRDMELQTQLDNISQYCSAKDMERLLKRFDNLEKHVAHIKTGMHQQPEELKTSIHQPELSITESQKGLETVNMRLESLNTDLGNFDSKLGTCKHNIKNMIRSPDFVILQRAAGEGITVHVNEKEICGHLRKVDSIST